MAPRGLGEPLLAALPVDKRNAIIPRPRDRLSSAGSRRCFTSWIPQAAGGKAGLFMARSLVTDSSAETEPRTLSSRWLYGRQHSAGPNRSIASPPRSLNIATALHAEAITDIRMGSGGWGFVDPAVLQRMGRERLQHGLSSVGYPTIRAMNSAESRRLHPCHSGRSEAESRNPGLRAPVPAAPGFRVCGASRLRPE